MSSIRYIMCKVIGSVCRSNNWKKLNQGAKPVFINVIHTIEDRGSDDDDEILIISTIEVNATIETRHARTRFTSGEFQPLASQSGRVFKSKLPCKIQPSKIQEEDRNWLKARQDNQSYYYKRHTKELPELLRDQPIYAQDPVRKTWNTVRVRDLGKTLRSYIVKTEAGAQLRRNRIHQTKQCFQ